MALTMIEEQLDFVKKIINEYLNQVFETSGIKPELLEVMRYGTLNGGKRLRPFLIYCWGQILDVPVNNLKPLMAAAELIHCYSLVHDDLPIVDNSPLRRGQPTTHIKFNNISALLAGSALYTLGIEQIICSNYKVTLRNELVRTLLHATGGNGLLMGQMLDCLYDTKQSALTVDDIEHMQHLKTGELIKWSCMAPALLANASPNDLKLIEKFAYKLGWLYQLTDDLLDLTGQEIILGKPICQDLENEKVNLITLIGVKETQDKIKKLHNEAKYILKNFNNNETLSKTLDFIVQRTN